MRQRFKRVYKRTYKFRGSLSVQEAKKDAYLRRRYGISLQAYRQLLREQGGECAICGMIADTLLNVDHCHDTGRVRGLLCNVCNLGLGHFQDDPETLRQAARYIERAQLDVDWKPHTGSWD